MPKQGDTMMFCMPLRLCEAALFSIGLLLGVRLLLAFSPPLLLSVSAIYPDPRSRIGLRFDLPTANCLLTTSSFSLLLFLLASSF